MKTQMKKLASILLALGMVLSLGSCGKSGRTITTASELCRRSWSAHRLQPPGKGRMRRVRRSGQPARQWSILSLAGGS